MARSAGAGIQLMAKEGSYALLRLPSGELRQVHINCRATIGEIGNLDHENLTLGKSRPFPLAVSVLLTAVLR